MKLKITKAEFDALAEVLKACYKQNGDVYVLQVEGYEDPGELRRARDREKEEGRLARERAAQAEHSLDELRASTARNTGDIATLERSWNEKLTTQKTDFETKLSAKDKFIRDSLIIGNVKTLSSKLAGDNSLLLEPHVAARLSVDFTGEAPLLRVLDKDGKPSAMNLDDLEKELIADKKYSSIIIASRANGGAGRGGNGNGSGSGAVNKKFNELTEAERTEFFKRDPDGFNQASATARREARGY